jgi:uncharacterized protein YbjQ (UPF0145 family)
MGRTRDILVSTTPTIEGVKIIRHLKPVYANIVIGTNIFSDFTASLTDVFGGYSNKYQNKLNIIYEDAVKKIKQSCFDIGGNCVLGLKIDIDEISGKGKSMFMITAIGTAVFAEIELKNVNSSKVFNNKISVEDINELRLKNKIIGSVKDGKLNFSDKTWSFVTNNQMSEILLPALNYFETLDKNNNFQPSEEFNKYEEKLKIYIENLPNDNKIEQLYSFIRHTQSKISALKISLIIKELFLFDFEKTIELINSDTISIKKIGLKIATFDKSHYDSNDIDGLSKLLKEIETSFKELGEKTTKKKILSSKEQEIWICECDTTNPIADKNNYCSSCLNDIFGFKISELKPSEVIIYLEGKINLITELTK